MLSKHRNRGIRPGYLAVVMATLALTGMACNNTRSAPIPGSEVTATTSDCFGCHGGGSTLSNRVLSAQARYPESRHANGLATPIVNSLQGTVETITIVNNGVSGCTSATVSIAAPSVTGGVQATATATVGSGVITGLSVTNKGSGYASTSRPTVTITPVGCSQTPTAYANVRETIIDWTWGGSRAYTQNGANCARCHTHEGFLAYLKADHSNSGITGTIEFPSPVGCFTCHDPHNKGDFSLREPDGAQVPFFRLAGQYYSKSKGNTCANCHQIRDDIGTTHRLRGIYNAITGSSGSVPTADQTRDIHYGGQAEMVSNVGGAEYNGVLGITGGDNGTSGCSSATVTIAAAPAGGLTATANAIVDSGVIVGYQITNPGFGYTTEPAVTVNASGCTTSPTATAVGKWKDYSPAGHALEANANCVTCHMTTRTGVTVSDHAFAIKAKGTNGNVAGCNTSGCHSSATTASVGTTGNGYFMQIDLIFRKDGSDNFVSGINNQLKALHDPDTNTGILRTFYNNCIADGACGSADAGYSLTFGSVSAFSRKPSASGANAAVPRVNVHNAQDIVNGTGGTAAERMRKFMMAYWNYKYVQLDNSMGVHNPAYAKRLLYDSCEDICGYIGNNGGTCDVLATCGADPRP